MGLFNKIFGPSEFQLEFQKAHSLKWFLAVKNINSVEYTYRNSKVKNSFLSSIIIFDFENDFIHLRGDIIPEVFDYQEIFQIVKHTLVEGELIFYISPVYDNEIVMKCIVRRDYILFEATRRHWIASINSNNIQCFTNSTNTF
jgi:hypothetical protein